MFRIISNIVASFVRTATLAQRLDDAVSFADGQCELVANLQSELANTYRRIDELRTLNDRMEVVTDDNAALRRSLAEMRSERDALKAERNAAKAAFAEAVQQWNKLDAQLDDMRCERDALKNEVATLRAAATPRPASPDLDQFDGGCAADR